MRNDDGPRSAIARYAYGWSNDRAAAVRELKLIAVVLGATILGIVLSSCTATPPYAGQSFRVCYDQVHAASGVTCARP